MQKQQYRVHKWTFLYYKSFLNGLMQYSNTMRHWIYDFQNKKCCMKVSCHPITGAKKQTFSQYSNILRFTSVLNGCDVDTCHQQKAYRSAVFACILLSPDVQSPQPSLSLILAWHSVCFQPNQHHCCDISDGYLVRLLPLINNLLTSLST